MISCVPDPLGAGADFIKPFGSIGKGPCGVTIVSNNIGIVPARVVELFEVPASLLRGATLPGLIADDTGVCGEQYTSRPPTICSFDGQHAGVSHSDRTDDLPIRSVQDLCSAIVDVQNIVRSACYCYRLSSGNRAFSCREYATLMTTTTTNMLH